MSEGESCDITAKNSCCSTPNPTPKVVDFKVHWDKAYSNSTNEKLGWFETDLSPMLKLIEQSGVSKASKIINIGAGNTVLIDELVKQNFSQLLATDISPVALTNLENRINSNHVQYIVDDLTQPSKLNKSSEVDLWIDRAVLHFFTETKDQNTYFDLLKRKVKKGGFVILAEFGLGGAKKCSGLDVKRYSNEEFQAKLGQEFEQVNSFNYNYTMPSGDLREYIYTLFIRS